MIAISVLLVIAILIAVFVFLPRPDTDDDEDEDTEFSPKVAKRLDELMNVATAAIKERRTYRAEKALLTILRFDEKNASAYNRLGILYAKEKKYPEAIECFEIANGIEANPASIHNMGLIYLEMGKYERAAISFEQSIEMEGDVSAHYMALAKAEIKLEDYEKAIEALESAYDLAPTLTILKNIQQIYKVLEQPDMVESTGKRIDELESHLATLRQPARRTTSPRR
jgi:tetratricopeptide (TPR) repeat protein